jgi:hypothetical protein
MLDMTEQKRSGLQSITCYVSTCLTVQTGQGTSLYCLLHIPTLAPVTDYREENIGTPGKEAPESTTKMLPVTYDDV